MKRPLLVATCLLLAGGACGGGAPVQPPQTSPPAQTQGTQSMSFTELSLTSEQVREPPVLAVRDTDRDSAPITHAPVVAGDGAMARIGVDVGNTSRAPVRLPAKGWAVTRTVQIDPNLVPATLLAVSDRALVIAADRAALYSRDGERLGTYMRGGGNPILVPGKGVFLTPTPRGDIQARSLDDGRTSFLISGAFGDTHSRPFVAWEGARMLITGRKSISPIERRTRGVARPQIVLQVVELPASIKASEDYFTDAVSSRTIMRESDSVHVAISGQSVVVATDNRLYVMDMSLNVQSIVEGDFRVLSLSVDEQRRAYMATQTPGGNELWVLTLDGVRLLRMPLPPPRAGGYTPPIVGYDHTIMLPVDKRIIVISPEGRHIADYPVSENFAGAVTTADDRLLVADGSELVAFERDGRAHVLADVGDDILRTAPALLAGGTVWLASGQHLYRLEPSH
jgi:hypothetical protein